MALFIDFDLPPVLCLLLEKTQPAEEMVDSGYDLSKVDPSSDICFKFSREDVVAELILMVNPLYRIMSVAKLNYEWCLALRSVLGTSGVWPK